MVNAKLTYFRPLAFIIALMALAFAPVKAQNVSVSAEMDSTLIFIGGQIDLRLQLSQPADMELGFPVFNDTITRNIEIVRAGRIDTLSRENNRLLLQQTITITSFDSGLHYIPPIVFEEAGRKLGQAIQTNNLSLMVINPFEEVDPQKGLIDIKQPLNTPFHLSELYKYLPWILGIILLAGIIVFVVLKYMGRDIPIKIFTREEPKIPPHELALQELNHIREEKLWQRDMVKLYYSKVTDTLRRYIEERFQVNAMEQTSDEILASLRYIDDIDQKSKENLNQILSTADLVKFARHEPLPDENDLSMINAYFFINQTKLEEIKSLEEEKEAMLQKEMEESAETTKPLN